MHPWVGLSDHVRLGVMTRWVTPELVAGVLEKCRVRDKKPGALPAGFMVYFTLALALFQQDSYDDVAEHLVGSVPELSASIPNKSSFTRARGRLGPLVLEAVLRSWPARWRRSDCRTPSTAGCGWPRWTVSFWTRRTRR
ncbi:transposase domain-containing protein [Streptomyces sp. NPDC058619]|uniref:transposase domain-containing protein n=1 Tax=unclassified Streptomyces TaxID=2593676 RepID=UPI00365EDCCE